MEKLLERLDLAEKAGKIEIRGDRKFFNGTLEKIQIWSKLKTVNWTDAKNAIERKENSRTRN
jgi:hypothetical protein